MIIGSFTPLVKIFLPWFLVPDLDKDGKPKLNEDGTPKEIRVTCNDMIKDPKRITAEESFRFLVPRSVGGFWVSYNRPVNVADQNLVVFLTGDDIGQQIDPTWEIATETDCYGVAQIAIRPDVQGALVSSVAGAGGDVTKILKEEQAAAKAAHDRAVKVSEHRVIRAARRMVGNLKKQRQADKEAGRGHYVPSPQEFLAAFYLAKVEKEEAAAMKLVVDQFTDMMDAIEAKGQNILGG